VIEAVETIANDTSAPLAVWVEPWADTLVVPPGERFTFSGSSELPGGFEVERTPTGVVIYAWAGSTAVVRSGEVIVRTFDIPVPGIPAGMSMKGFVGFMFGESSTSSKLRQVKPWWRFW
jgi:hypothetical protein